MVAKRSGRDRRLGDISAASGQGSHDQQAARRNASAPLEMADAGGVIKTVDVELWPLDRFVFYNRNPRRNDAAVDRMCESIREFGLKIPVLARSDGEVVDGHLRLKAASKLMIREVPVILCDE